MPKIGMVIAQKTPAKAAAGIGDHWVSDDFQVEMTHGRRYKVAGRTYGVLGVCLSNNVEGRWLLIHSPTCRVIGWAGTEAAATKIGDVLWTKACPALRLKTVDEVMERLPEWVRPWIIYCRSANDYRDPKPFIEGEQ